MRVLVVEDEPKLLETLCLALGSPKANMIATPVSNGVHAASMIEQARHNNRPFDAIVLDLTLPGMDGLDVLRGMRAKGDPTPVLVLTARSTLADRLDGFNTGADDYLGKPFETEELLVRLQAITRRRAGPEPALASVGNLSWDRTQRKFMVDGALLTLRPQRHAVLEALMKRRGHPVHKDFLQNLDEQDKSEGSVQTLISRLRKDLKVAGATVEIETIHNVGYVLKEACARATNE